MREQIEISKIVPNAPILRILKQDETEIINSKYEGIVIAQPIPDDGVAHLMSILAEVVPSTRSLDSTNYQFTFAVLGSVVAILAYGSYLWWSYYNNEDELLQNPRMSF